VTEKRLTVVLFGSDRNLWRGGPLKIRVSDVFASGGPKILKEDETEEPTVQLRLDLPFDAGQVYGVTFSAPGHRPAWQLIRRPDFLRPPDNVEVDDLILRLMLVPDAGGTADLARGLRRLQQNASPLAAPGSGIDAAAYQGLDVAAQMAFLNIEAKLRETTIDGAPLISFVRAVRHVAVDRVFLLFDAALKSRMPRASEFAGAPGHGAPKDVPGLPGHPDSWKHTRFAEGNVQLSFSKDAEPFPAGSGSLAHSADVDIDLGRGLAHAKEWLVNNVFLPGHKTNQALVYGLLFAQGILPQYVLDPVAARVLIAARRLERMGVTTTTRGRRRPQRRTRSTRARKTTTRKSRK